MAIILYAFLFCFLTKQTQCILPKAAEIQRLVELGAGLVKLFATLEADMGEKHKEFLKSEAFLKANEGAKGDFVAKVAEAEAAGALQRLFYFILLF